MVACYSSEDSEKVLAVVKVLVEASASISSANLLGITPLMFAASHGHTSTVSYLLSLNDSFDAIDNEGKNALFHAIDGKHEEISKILIDAGIDLNVANKYGVTAKNYARNEHCDTILDLFPPEIERYQTPSSYLSYNKFENLIPGMSEV
jgi:ankyrin repeat protein